MTAKGNEKEKGKAVRLSRDEKTMRYGAMQDNQMRHSSRSGRDACFRAEEPVQKGRSLKHLGVTSAPNIIPLPQPKPASTSPWQATQHTNLQKDKRGRYRVNAKVCGRIVRKVLKTRSLTVALAKRDEMLSDARRKAGARADGVATFGKLADTYLSIVANDPDLRDSSKKYRRETVTAIKRSWPALLVDKPIDSFKLADFALWAGKLRSEYSATRYNAALESMRAILKPAVESGLFAKNPIDEGIAAEKIKRAPVVVSDKTVPTPEQLTKLFRALKPNSGRRFTAGSRRSNAYYLARFLRHFSLRIGTALALTPAMVNPDAEEFHIPSELVKWGGKGKLYRVPIFPEMFKVLAELDKAFGKDRERVLPFKCSPRPLKDACRIAGIEPALTWHSFRHVWSSYALMKTKDAPLVASWRGDKDGGGTLLKIYSHILDDHSKKMARRMR